MSLETITYCGLKWDVEYSYQPEEPMELEYPGCAEEFTIEKISLRGNDLTEFFIDNDLIEMMEEFLVDQIKG
jgi:hypothetical protein